MGTTMTNTETKEKKFDCIEMKREIHARTYEEIKDMTDKEVVAYFNEPTDQPFFQWLRSQKNGD
jgi:hypothetical protein